jgi:hypothetical protein
VDGQHRDRYREDACVAIEATMTANEAGQILRRG